MDGQVQDDNLGMIRGWRGIIKFTLPMIVTMLFISTYTVVDGLFVSNFIDTDALAAVNILMPVATLLSAVGFMFSTGGSAYVSNLLGKGETMKASSSFTLIILVSIVIALILTAIGLLFMDPIARILGADDTLIDGAVEYGTVYVLFAPFLILQFLFTQFLVVAGKPKMSLAVSVAGGVANMVLDYLLIVVLDMGMTGAALASGMGSLVPAVFSLPILFRKTNYIFFTKPVWNPEAISRSCTNGVSEMVTELSGGIIILFYNLVMMSYIGPDGVAAITIVSYVQFLALSIIIGYSNGIAPVMSFDHGADDRKGMQDVLRISLTFVMSISLAVFIIIELFAPEIAALFASSSEEVMAIVVNGSRVFAIGFLFLGFNIYASSLFTSLSNGLISAAVSAVRSLVLLAPLIVILPYLLGIDWVWAASPLTEFITALIAVFFILRLNPRYGYLRERSASVR